ncbi:hypothetical protein G6F57_022375 [Rhizopus arrhizus]|nr:hypothetical protein G6F57_022375 [Rhizopus arrhizus]
MACLGGGGTQEQLQADTDDFPGVGDDRQQVKLSELQMPCPLSGLARNLVQCIGLQYRLQRGKRSLGERHAVQDVVSLQDSPACS